MFALWKSVAYYGTSFVVGGATGGTFEYSKNRVFGLKGTVGGYFGSILGGGVGGTGYQILGRGAPIVLNNIALGGVAGAGGDFVGQEVDMRLGNRRNLDGRSILVSGLIGGAAGGASSLEVRVNGLNAGSNSNVAIYKGLQARINSGNVNQFQLRYGVRAGVGQGVLGMGQAGAGSVYVGIYQDGNR